ncbi:hypothetical protein GCM10023318_11880 [Nocardia callitridis]|uniref:Uncharacterized protein n=1 Tax=Nocardia callitridis TaxID=648753 RepID=A0ABP9JZB9_9NOCA
MQFVEQSSQQMAELPLLLLGESAEEICLATEDRIHQMLHRRVAALGEFDVDSSCPIRVWMPGDQSLPFRAGNSLTDRPRGNKCGVR